MPKTTFEGHLIAFFEFLKQRPSGQVPTNQEYGLSFRRKLEQIGSELERSMRLPNDFPKLYIQSSKGANVLPLVPWVVILPKGKKVSSWHSVGICFDLKGAGLVAGIMWSPLGPSSLPQPLGGDRKLSLTIDSGKPETSYSRKFVNPIEVSYDQVSESRIVNHLRECLLEVFE